MIRARGLVFAALLVLAVAGVAPAAAFELKGTPIQGGLLSGRTEPGTHIALDGRAVRVDAEGRFILGFGRDAPPRAELVLVHADGRRERRTLEIEQREYAIQRIDGLPENMVSPSPEELERIARENRLIAAARARDTDAAYFAAGFIWPAEGPVSGVYGSQRVLNGEPRQPHYGVDIAAPEESLVVAAADGLVALAEDDLFYTGGTVILDHGMGLSSAFSHLSAVLVEAGEFVRRGEPIGRVGASGRATGPHLDWRLNWFEVRLDPALVVPPPGAPASAAR